MSVDITKAVEAIRAYSVEMEMAAIMAIPALGPILNIPIVGWALKKGIHWILDTASHFLERQAFYFNTAIRKASEAHDFVDAAMILDSVPQTISKEEYAKLEQEKMAAFRRLVDLTE